MADSRKTGCTCKDGPHLSSCASHNVPAYPPGPCDCGVVKRTDAKMKAVREANGLAREKFDKGQP